MAPIQYYGGKGMLVKKLLGVVPAGGRPYCEPYCGGASLFFAREPAPVEVLNDLHSLVINLFRCLQNRKTFEELKHRITYTLYSREEFVKAIGICKKAVQEGFKMPSVDVAWAYYTAQNQGFSGIDATNLTEGRWSRAIETSTRGMAGNCSRWNRRKDLLDVWHERLSRVQIDHIDAFECIKYWDNDEAVFYIDPPYVFDTRVNGSRSVYAHEQGDDHHEKLVELLLSIKGKAVLSGYEHPIYQPLLDAGWKIVKWETSCHAAGKIRGSKLQGLGSATKHIKRIECVYINPQAQKEA
jgi:DNA adenine methylase